MGISPTNFFVDLICTLPAMGNFRQCEVLIIVPVARGRGVPMPGMGDIAAAVANRGRGGAPPPGGRAGGPPPRT